MVNGNYCLQLKCSVDYVEVCCRMTGYPGQPRIYTREKDIVEHVIKIRDYDSRCRSDALSAIIKYPEVITIALYAV